MSTHEQTGGRVDVVCFAAPAAGPRYVQRVRAEATMGINYNTMFFGYGARTAFAAAARASTANARPSGSNRAHPAPRPSRARGVNGRGGAAAVVIDYWP